MLGIGPHLHRWIREGELHARRIAQRGRKGRLVILPNSGRPSSGSNFFWGCEMAAELRRRGWRVTIVPPEFDLGERRRLVRLERPDAILLIKGRHPLNRPELYDPTPCLLILDDADYVPGNFAEQTLAACRDAAAVIAGNAAVGAWARRQNSHVEVVWVSHPIPARRPSPPNAKRAAVVAWAHAMPDQYPVEAAFVQQAVLLAARERRFEFRLHGVYDAAAWSDYLGPIRDAGVDVRTIPFVPDYGDHLRSLAEVAVGLHPVCLEHPYSEGKSFGKLLAYMASDVAAVTHAVLDHAAFFRHEETAMLADTSESAAAAIVRLLDDPQFRQELTDRCYEDFVERLSTPVAARKVEAVIEAVC